MPFLKKKPKDLVVSEKKTTTDESVVLVGVQAIVQCSACGFWGTMNGLKQPDHSVIFQCPECNAKNAIKLWIDG